SAFGQVSEERDVGSFSEIKVGEAIDLYLIQGSQEKLRIEADRGDVDDVETKVSGGTLKIGMRPGNYRHTVKVYVTYRKIEGLTATSASNVYTEGKLRSEKLYISVSSAASAELEVEAEMLSISASSSGDVEISGSAEVADIHVSSAGDVDAYDLVVNEVSVKASSAGDAGQSFTIPNRQQQRRLGQENRRLIIYTPA
ncbi:MAG: DUF2807 domain-containing protein, partial [Cyclobacteriaceae bacterium]